MPRFCKKPPSIVVLESSESIVHKLKKPDEKPVKRKIDLVKQVICMNPLIRFIDITKNRISKAIMLRYTKTRIRYWMGLRNFDYSTVKNFTGKPFLIHKREYVTEQQKNAKMLKILPVLREYKDYFDKRNIRFIFMPIPNKETVYYKVAESEKQPTFLNKLISTARDAGIEVLDVKSAFDSTLKKDPNMVLYIRDDSHWNRNGTEIAADLLADMIRTKDQTVLPMPGGP